jgi:hypothetical protein
MNKVLALGLVALLIVVSAYVIFLSPEKPSQEKLSVDSVENNNVIDDNSITKEERIGESTLSQLRALNENLECQITFQENIDGEESTGTYFVNDGRVRGDFLIDAPDLSAKILSSIIIDDRYLYAWSEIEGEKYGTKMEVSTLTTGDGVESGQAISLDTEVKYDCAPWLVVDNSIFAPPGDVLFQDLSMLMEAGMEEALLYEE